MNTYLSAALLVFSILACDTSAANVTIHNSLFSKILDEKRQVVIKLPKSYDTQQNKHYPVLYLLDGPRNIDHTAGTVDLLNQSGAAPELIIVGIANTDRTRDFTPTKNNDPRGGAIGSGGGGDAFLDFIEKELIPYINQHYRSRNFKIISGHSSGGLLVIHSLQSRPELFQAHLAFSPAVWWSDRATISNTKKFITKTNKLDNFLYMNLGNESGEMRDVYDGFDTFLKQITPELFAYHSDIFANEPHNLTGAAGLFNALRHLFLPLNMPANQAQQGIKSIENYYALVSKQYGRKILPIESIVNNAAYFYLSGNKDTKKALELFAYNVKTYPKSANTYDGLADAYEQNGQLKLALKQMDLALQYNKEAGNENQASHDYFKRHKQRILALIDSK